MFCFAVPLSPLGFWIAPQHTVFRLRTSTTVPTTDGGTTVVFALASREATESVTTAHERDMIQMREQVVEKRSSSDWESAIAPADDILQSKDLQTERTRVVVAREESSSTAAAPMHKPFANAKAKPTTAASFFAKPGAKKESSVKTTKKQKVVKATTTTTTTTTTENNKVVSNSNISQEKENIKNIPKKAKVGAPSKVGNADDFEADEEESDDEVVVVVKKNNNRKEIAAARKEAEEEEQPAPPSPQPASPVRGAMDAFAEKDPNRKRKRRKKLVEKTTMVNGYLRTETEAIWEDVPTDEEEEEENKKSLPKPKALPAGSQKKKPTKQMGLMGFFAKKK